MFGAGKIGVHDGFDLTAFPQSIVSFQKQHPAAIAIAKHRILGPVPVIEVTGQIQLMGIGRPFPVDPAPLHPVEAEVIVGVGKVIQGLARSQNAVLGRMVQKHAQINVPGKGLQLGIEFQ